MRLNIDKTKYVELKETITWKEVAAIFNKDNGTNYSWQKVRESVRNTYEKSTAEEEYKPKYALDGENYIVHYGKNGYLSVAFTEEELRKALKLYCLARMTIEQTHLSMGWTRRELYSILKAFDIVKDSQPITPNQLEKLNADQIAEYVRINKLRYVQEKLNASKHNDQERRVKQMDNVLFWQNEIIEKVNKLEFKPYDKIKIKKNNKRKIVVFLTDVHAGLEVDNYFNTYNIDVMNKQLKRLASHIIDKYEGYEVTIAELGDTIHGHIHGSVKTYSIPTSEAVTQVIKAYTNFLLTLQPYCSLRFSKVNGSHESIEKGKQDRTEENSFGNIIYDMVKSILSNYNIQFIDRLKGLNNSIIKLYDYSIVLGHGDSGGMNKIKDSDRLFKEHNAIEFDMGHLHHLKNEDFNGFTLYYNEPFCGGDQFAGKLLLNSQKGTRIVEYSKVGREDEHLFRY